VRLSSTTFRLYLGNSALAVHVNGKPQRLATSPNPVAYVVTTKGVNVIPDTNPPCA